MFLVASCFFIPFSACCARLPAAPGFLLLPCGVSSHTLAVHGKSAGGNPAREQEKARSSREPRAASRRKQEKARRNQKHQEKAKKGSKIIKYHFFLLVRAVFFWSARGLPGG